MLLDLHNLRVYYETKCDICEKLFRFEWGIRESSLSVRADSIDEVTLKVPVCDPSGKVFFHVDRLRQLKLCVCKECEGKSKGDD